MSLTEDQVNHIINDQEEVIADLQNKLLEMTDSRDLALGKSLELVAAMKRIECISDWSHGGDCKTIARRAIDAFQGK